MKEIGGYIELDQYSLPMLHEDAIDLNCGRICLLYLIKKNNIKKIWMPKYICDSVVNLCKENNVEVLFYHININFQPEFNEIPKDDWIYIVNYFGQLSNEYITEINSNHKNVIIDNAQAYFQRPIENVNTIYTCRKFFGVPDGAFLYSNGYLNQDFETDESYNRMNFLLGRFERTANEFYSEYVANNKYFANQPIKKMSKLTKNLLHGINYNNVKKIREENFKILEEYFKDKNILKLKLPEGAFMYPLYIKDGYLIRKELQKNKIYIPMLWPNVLEYCNEDEIEYDMTKNILPLPVDQRYTKDDMLYILKKINEYETKCKL